MNTAYWALACVCVLWGTTYLGIRIAVEDLAPATLMCVRYLLSGALLLAFSMARGAKLPKGHELATLALCGILTIGLGTGALVYAEVWVPSGLASLFVTTGSLWLVLMEAALPGGEPLHGPTIGALLIGAAGAAMLVAPDQAAAGPGEPATPAKLLVAGFLLIQLGYAGWGVGSILQRRLTSKAQPFLSAGVQQLATGAAYIVPALLSPPSHWTHRALGATLYLAIFGGALGYSCYVVAVTRLPVAIASTYSYVNPLVAVLLGVWLYGEHFTLREGIAMVIIFVGVALVKRAQRAAAATQST